MTVKRYTGVSYIGKGYSYIRFRPNPGFRLRIWGSIPGGRAIYWSKARGWKFGRIT